MRNCLVILNSSNFAGTVNHLNKNGDGTYSKLRVDYKELLTYLIGDRTCLGSYIISQQDTSAVNRKTPDQIQANTKFINRLSKFGWTPVCVSYNSEMQESNSVIDSIWQTAMSVLADSNGNWAVDPETTDIVFVNGSSSWFDIVNAFSESGFQVEVAYPKIATSKAFTANYAFLDLTQFLYYSNNLVSNKEQ